MKDATRPSISCTQTQISSPVTKGQPVLSGRGRQPRQPSGGLLAAYRAGQPLAHGCGVGWLPEARGPRALQGGALPREAAGKGAALGGRQGGAGGKGCLNFLYSDSSRGGA